MDKHITSSSGQINHDKFRSPKPGILILFSIVFCFIFGGTMPWYIVPEYIQNTLQETYNVTKGSRNISCDMDGTGNESSAIDRIQKESAEWNLTVMLAVNTPAIFTSLVLGAYSDLIGRKKLLALSLCGVAVKEGTVAIIIRFQLDFIYFVFGYLVEGITGSFPLLIAISFSYLSDLIPSGKQRTVYIVLLESVMSLALTLSSIALGYFIKHTGFFYPSVTGTTISLLGVFIAILALPETLNQTRDSNRSVVTNDPGRCSVLLQTLSKIWNLYFGQNSARKTAKYMILLLAFMFTCVPQYGNFDPLYQLGSPFCWSTAKIGWYGALKTCLGAIGGLFSAYVLNKCLQIENIAAIGILSLISGLIVEAFAKTSTVLYLVPVISFLGFATIPMIRILMSRMTCPTSQGALFASIGAIETICVLLGAVTTNAVYAATLKIMNGFVFLVSALYAIIALALIVSFIVVHRCYPDEDLLLHEVLIEEDSKSELTDQQETQ